jgi:NAD(P)-dependent dehydrogenase (short-subunit alcohol dehydrogenase family)
MGSEMKVFVITGVSSGFGRALTDAAVDAGHMVVGTVRREADAAAVAALGPNAHARVLDVTDDAAVAELAEWTEREVGPVDVLVANAGYGHEGTLEESTMRQLRDQFNVNVFGAVAAIKAVLPQMRARRSGHIIAITSMGGLMTIPGLTYYHGSKFALEGILGSLAKEVAPLGIKVTAVAPGSFRTNWAGRSMVRAASQIPDYEPVFGPQRSARHAANGNQLGDPRRAAAVMLELVAMDEPPTHLLLGSDALRLVAADRAAVDADLERWAELSRSTDSADGAQIAGT